MLERLQNNRVIKWGSNQITLANVIQLPMVLGWFGYFPGFWVISAPTLLAYAIVKRKAIYHWLAQKPKKISQAFSKGFVPILVDHYGTFFKILTTASLIALWELSIFSMLALYGLYRTDNKEWASSFESFVKRVGTLVAKLMPDFSSSNSNFSLTFMLRIGLILYLAYHAYYLNFLSLAVYSMIFGQIFLMFKGVAQLAKDAFQNIKHPVQAFVKNPGKIIGFFLGRRVAYYAFNGRLEGTLGPAYGYAESNGLTSGLLSSLFSPHGFFFLGESPTALALRRLSMGVKSIFTGMLFTSHIQTQGYFTGIVGPTSAQVVTFMIVGSLLGRAVESLINTFYQEVTLDAQHIKRKAPSTAQYLGQNLVDFIIQSRVYLLYIAISTPLFLNSAAGPALIAMGGGSLVLGTLFTAGASAAIIASFNIFSDLLIRTQRYFNTPPPPPVRKLPHLAIPLKKSTPADAKPAAVVVPPVAPVIVHAFKAAAASPRAELQLAPASVISVPVTPSI